MGGALSSGRLLSPSSNEGAQTNTYEGRDGGCCGGWLDLGLRSDVGLSILGDTLQVRPAAFFSGPGAASPPTSFNTEGHGQCATSRQHTSRTPPVGTHYASLNMTCDACTRQTRGGDNTYMTDPDS